jgi:putative nucleotidyltransferase with HDIG domain
MLRAAQFAARFRFWIEDDTFQAIRQRADRLAEVAPERIYGELVKMLTLSERPSIGVRAMQRLGLLPHVLPGLEELVGLEQPKKFHIHDAFDHTMVCLDAVPTMKLTVRLAALLHDIGKAPTARYSEEKGRVQFLGHENVGAHMAREVLEGLRAPKEVQRAVVRLVRCHMFSSRFNLAPSAVRRLLRRVGRENIFDLVDLRVGDRIASGKANLTMGKVGALRKRIEEELAEPVFDRKNLAINGSDLVEALGIAPGPEIGRLLGLLLEVVIEDPERNTREGLLELARSFHAEVAATK